jgi:hypothetical protein
MHFGTCVVHLGLPQTLTTAITCSLPVLPRSGPGHSPRAPPPAGPLLTCTRAWYWASSRRSPATAAASTPLDPALIAASSDSSAVTRSRRYCSCSDPPPPTPPPEPPPFWLPGALFPPTPRTRDIIRPKFLTPIPPPLPPSKDASPPSARPPSMGDPGRLAAAAAIAAAEPPGGALTSCASWSAAARSDWVQRPLLVGSQSWSRASSWRPRAAEASGHRAQQQDRGEDGTSSATKACVD